MRSIRSRRYKAFLDRLPASIQKAASEKFKIFAENPFDSRLDRKPIEQLKHLGTYIEVEITGRRYRAVARVTKENNEDVYYWIFIGTHSDFDRFVQTYSG